MTPVRRWLLVVFGATLIVATPVAISLIPASSSVVSANTLRQQIAHSSTLAWSGAVKTRGTLKIPATNSFGGISALLGDNNSLRVWWRDPTHWRVDKIRQTGETDLIRNGSLTTSWNFESETATMTPYSAVRLPDASDLLPSRLAKRLLSGATAAEVSRLPSKRVAGLSAAGLRLNPSDPRSTIDHVDVWADTASGLPLRVEAFDAADSRPIVTTELTTVDLKKPDPSTTEFIPPPGIKIRRQNSLDVAAGANAFAPFVLPNGLAGLKRHGDAADFGAVGVYGSGPTAFILIPLRRNLSDQVRNQLVKDATASTTDAGTALKVGPLSVLLTPRERGRGIFLLAGTVTPKTLEQASTELRDTVTFR
ncbi:MAG: hypothetical protein H7288_07915 [Kineosporiaceae bacterium]|nr:hypothetical protein [Aeromicrobium sp.]